MSKFKPMLVSFNEKLYNKALAASQEKHLLRIEATNWIQEVLSIEDIDTKQLHENMLKLFKELVLKTYKDVNLLELTSEKLIEAKEFNIAKLIDLQKQYEDIDLPIIFEDGSPVYATLRSDFEVWTTNDKQDLKLTKGNKFITPLQELAEDVHIMPRFIINSTQGTIIFDHIKNKYIVSPEYIFT